MHKEKMICPNCGAEMNHHAMKIDYSVDDATLIDPAFGGVVQEVHTCPACGHVALRSPSH
jgi:rRNA maturation endonuclease Nob1